MSIQLKSKFDNTQKYHIYLDLDVVNNKGISEKLSFLDIRNAPFLYSPENYFFSIIRFQLNTPSLPLWIPSIQTGQNDVNQTIYTFSCSFVYLGIRYVRSATVVYLPEEDNADIPATPFAIQDVSTKYYYVLTYTQIIVLLNKALDLAFSSLRVLLIGLGYAASNWREPFFFYDEVTGLFKLYAGNETYIGDPMTTEILHIYMNQPMFSLLPSFLGSTKENRYGLNNPDLYFKFKIYQQHNLNLASVYNPPYTTSDAIFMTQNTPSLCMFNPITSIVFTSSLLPICPSFTSKSKPFNEITGLNNIGNNNNVSPIITDFIVSNNGASDTYRNNITYVPTSEYRLTDLFGGSPISSLDITVYFKDRFNNLYPFLIDSGSTANIKMLFRRKDFNTSDILKVI